MRSPYGVTIFCDDIRYEISGKLIYVGIYQNSLIVLGKGPQGINKLECAVRVMIPVGHPAKEMVIKIILDQDGKEKVLAESPKISLGGSTSESKDNPERFVNCLSHITISPLLFTSDCVLKSRAYLDSEEVRLGVLAIEIREEAPVDSDSAVSASN